MKTNEIDESNTATVETKTNGNKISAALLVRKFKFSFELAQKLSDFITENTKFRGWVQVQDGLPTHKCDILVYGKPVKGHIEEYNYYLACFDIHCGWKNMYDGDLLYVIKWIELPKDEK